MEKYMEFIENAWQHFIYTGEVDKEVRSDIKESWIRCKAYGVNHLSGKGGCKHPSIDKLLEENFELLAVAKPIMENVYNIVAGSGFAMILADRNGYIIEVIGDEDIMKRVHGLNFLKGELWTEEAVGTNAIGTALYLNKPIQTIGAEHFGVKQHSWTCSACPIHDEEGNIIGCINMSGNYYDAHSHTLAIVTAAAESIQKQLALTLSYNLLNTTFDSIFEGMIVIDESRKVKKVNGRALEILNISLREAMYLDVNSVFKDINISKLLQRKKELNNLECDFYINNNRIRCVANVCEMRGNKKSFGIIITFTEAKNVHNLVNKVIGYKAKYKFEDIITENKKMKAMIEFAKRAAQSDCNILIEGESGTGKELIAQSVHSYSDRAKGPFVAVNCASIPRELVESELFGYERGAFTGAAKEGHPGKFELADGGTIFLDEIGELPLDIQSKLLRVLDNEKITRVGGTYEKQLDVRVIGATNRILEKEIIKKHFREDLYYRLSVMTIKTIPLKERLEDIEVLVKHFVKGLNEKNGKNINIIDEKYIEELKHHKWQGNVRELRNRIERDYYLSEGNLLGVNIGNCDKVEHDHEVEEEKEIIPMQVLEKRAIEDAINQCGGNIVKASKLLNISRATFYRKIKKYGIKL